MLYNYNKKSDHEKCLGFAYHVYNDNKHPRADEIADNVQYRELWFDLWNQEIVVRISKPLKIVDRIKEVIR